MNSSDVSLRDGQARVGFLSRALSLTGFREGELRRALLLALSVFVLLASYYVLKTVRELLILSEHSAQVKSYSAAGQALLLLVLIPAYSYMVTRLDRSRLMTGIGLFFASHLAVFYGFGSLGFHVSIPFFLWVGVFNVLIVSQFWALANDLHDSESGKRLFPVIGIGSALGAWMGSRAAGALCRLLTPYEMMLVAGAGLLLYLLIGLRMEARPSFRSPEAIGGKSAFSLVCSNRYLRLVATMVLLLNVVNSLGEFMLSGMALDAAVRSGAPVKEALGVFYADFYGQVNLLAVVLQVFVVSRVFRHTGVAGALLVLPVLAMGSYGLMAAVPLFAVVRSAKVLENSVDYSLQNTARHALFLNANRETKFKAKVAIDTLFWRIGDVLQAVVVMAGTQLAFTLKDYAWINMVLAGGWLAVILCIRQELAQTGNDESAVVPAVEVRRGYGGTEEASTVPVEA